MDNSSEGPDLGITDDAVGVVVIGRNEGARLRRCLESLGGQVASVVYVDSGSDDDSVALAREMGAVVVELDTAIPFTAARARNEGFEALTRASSQVALVQFVDGDCEVEAGWLHRAVQGLQQNPELAVVFGRRRERARDTSIYNLLCDLEWDVPIGEVLSCGGDALMRVSAFGQCGGFDPTLIAGEEPELSFRLRALGWKIRCIAAPMTIHDADMHTFGQWWRRGLRAGYVEAEGLARLGRQYPRLRAAMSNIFFAVVVPVVVVAGVTALLAIGDLTLAMLVAAGGVGLYAVMWLKILRYARRRWPGRDARLYATFCMLAKWPAVHGIATYCWRRLWRQDRRLIEYKQAKASELR